MRIQIHGEMASHEPTLSSRVMKRILLIFTPQNKQQ